MVRTEHEIRAASEKSGGVKAGVTGESAASIFGIESIAGNLSGHSFSDLVPASPVEAEHRAADGWAEEAFRRSAAKDDAGQTKRFYKRLSKNDVDLKSSPGQIIIPIAFKSFFEPLSEPQKTKAGAMQSERFFHLKYENSGEIVKNARVIFYVPSPEHPRKNSEVRFALRNRKIFDEFEQNDVLVFAQAPESKREQYAYTVKRIAHSSPDRGAYPDRFAWIVE